MIGRRRVGAEEGRAEAADGLIAEVEEGRISGLVSWDRESGSGAESV